MRISKPGIEKAVRKILCSCSRDLPPTPLDRICLEQNIRVFYTNGEDPFFCCGTLLSTDCAELKTVIYIPVGSGPESRRWMISHLLGHIVLRHERCDYGEKNEMEDLASEFAAELLMPEKILRKYIDTQLAVTSEARAVLELADAFEVPPQDMWKRLREFHKKFAVSF